MRLTQIFYGGLYQNILIILEILITLMSNLMDKALQYYKDFIAPSKKYKKPNEQEIEALTNLNQRLV